MNRPDGNQANLRSAAYEAVMEMIKNCPKVGLCTICRLLMNREGERRGWGKGGGEGERRGKEGEGERRGRGKGEGGGKEGEMRGRGKGGGGGKEEEGERRRQDSKKPRERYSQTDENFRI